MTPISTCGVRTPTSSFFSPSLRGRLILPRVEGRPYAPLLAQSFGAEPWGMYFCVRCGDPFPPPTLLLSWFLDAPGTPFGMHRMAIVGKAAGKDVGMWFGPSVAPSATRMLVVTILQRDLDKVALLIVWSAPVTLK
ncbi:hypothetical protein B0H10DRAFT_2211287 [Mycena sp. CBHHK59/15]|nr:hypothetical protein B0H10DRAFT_2211287 [Mycena sp. CBHHK59/15]